jgi:hypothetical protein
MTNAAVMGTDRIESRFHIFQTGGKSFSESTLTRSSVPQPLKAQKRNDCPLDSAK